MFSCQPGLWMEILKTNSVNAEGALTHILTSILGGHLAPIAESEKDGEPRNQVPHDGFKNEEGLIEILIFLESQILC